MSGPMLASGYLGDPARTAEVFVDGWSTPPTLGHWDPDGRLRVLGRVDDVIIPVARRGTRPPWSGCSPAQPGVRAACVVGLADRSGGHWSAAAWSAPTRPAWTPWAGQRGPRRAGGRLGAPADARAGRTAGTRIGKPDRAEVVRLLGAGTFV